MSEEKRSITFRWEEPGTAHVSDFPLEAETQMLALAEVLLSKLIDGQIREFHVEMWDEQTNES
jgi:hypothetical protein